MTYDDRLSEVLADARVVLFDFDGPLCDVFAGLSAAEVAGRLAAGAGDPFEALRLAYDAGAERGQEAEAVLTAAEVEAVALAGPPTPGAVEALRAVNASGRAVAVVSDHSAECVLRFLEAHGLGEYVAKVVGRPAGQPHLMKPNPFPLITAAEKMHMDVTNCVLIGDSPADVRAARTAGTTVVGYAGASHGAELLVEAGADAVVGDMRAVADVFTAA